MESFIIPNKNKSHSPTIQALTIVKPFRQSPSVLTRSLWQWDSRVHKNPVFITTSWTLLQKGEKFSTPTTFPSIAGWVWLSLPTLIPNTWLLWPIKTLMVKQFSPSGIQKEENAKLKSRFREGNRKISHRFSSILIQRTSLFLYLVKEPSDSTNSRKIFKKRTFSLKSCRKNLTMNWPVFTH